MRVRGDCLALAINGGDAVLVDQRQPYSTGDLVCVFLKPECVARFDSDNLVTTRQPC